VVKAESTAKAEEIEETFSLYVTNGRLAEILTAVNADSPVVIFELIVPGEPTSSPIKAPASPPPEKIQVEERVLVQVGLEESGLSTAVYIDDLVQSVKQLALEVLDGLGTVGMQLQVELATGGMSQRCLPFSDNIGHLLHVFSIFKQCAPTKHLSLADARTRRSSSRWKYRVEIIQRQSRN